MSYVTSALAAKGHSRSDSMVSIQLVWRFMAGGRSLNIFKRATWFQTEEDTDDSYNDEIGRAAPSLKDMKTGGNFLHKVSDLDFAEFEDEGIDPDFGTYGEAFDSRPERAVSGATTAYIDPRLAPGVGGGKAIKQPRATKPTTTTEPLKRSNTTDWGNVENAFDNASSDTSSNADVERRRSTLHLDDDSESSSGAEAAMFPRGESLPRMDRVESLRMGVSHISSGQIPVSNRYSLAVSMTGDGGQEREGLTSEKTCPSLIELPEIDESNRSEEHTVLPMIAGSSYQAVVDHLRANKFFDGYTEGTPEYAARLQKAHDTYYARFYGDTTKLGGTPSTHAALAIGSANSKSGKLSNA